jgi:hypothetical protein
MYVWKCIIYENDERYQLDETIVIYYHKYLYMFRASICPSSGVHVVYYCIWCSALCVVAVVPRSRSVVLCTVCKFVSDSWRWAYRCPKHVQIFMVINHNCCIKLVPLVIYRIQCTSNIKYSAAVYKYVSWCFSQSRASTGNTTYPESKEGFITVYIHSGLSC